MIQILLRKNPFTVNFYPLPLQDYIDLATTANISIFIFDSYLHGYYIHGKLPGNVSEGDASFIQKCLLREGSLA
jgi:hypothetical protein